MTIFWTLFIPHKSILGLFPFLFLHWILLAKGYTTSINIVRFWHLVGLKMVILGFYMGKTQYDHFLDPFHPPIEQHKEEKRSELIYGST